MSLNFEEKTEKLNKAAKEYLRSEMKSTVEDYKLLEDMNRVTTQKYHSMKEKCDNINQQYGGLKEKYETLAVYFAEIDKLEEKINTLEEMAYSIDGYTRKLETQFKKLES